MILKTSFRDIFLLIFGALFLLVISCKHEPDYNIGPQPPVDTTNTGITCNPDTSYFQNDVLPILISSCAMSGCHDAASAEDGIVLISYQTTLNTGKVTPGNPGNSDLYEKITETDPEDRMPPPPGQALSPVQIETIRKWIAQGAKNNKCDGDCDTTQFNFNTSILPIINNNCKGCHSGVSPSGGINLDGYAAIRTVAESGKLLGSISHQTGYVAMPQGGKLSDCNITQIRKWIENGTPNN